MLKHNLQNCNTPQSRIPRHNLLSSIGTTPSSFCIISQNYNKSISTKKSKKLRYAASNGVKAVLTAAEKSTSVKAVVTVLQTVGGALTHLGLSRGLDDIADLFGKTLLLELVSAELDPQTGLEKATVTAYAHKTGKHENETYYESDFVIPADFGEVGAILVENEHHKEMFIKNIVLDGLSGGSIDVSCNSWIHSKFDNPEKRIFFCNKSFLPSQTPGGLKKYREKELAALRGNGEGERKKSDRIYDYDVYNDLGDPDSDPDLARPVLGGPEHPYPRRCRTGRPRTKRDPLSESRSSSIYVPRDEAFSEVKQAEFSVKTVYSVLHAVVPSVQSSIIDNDLGFPHFTAIDTLFNEGVELPNASSHGFLRDIIPRIMKAVSDTGNSVLRFETPELIDRDKFAWFRDPEFGRQTLAGLNPCIIKLVTVCSPVLKSILSLS